MCLRFQPWLRPRLPGCPRVHSASLTLPLCDRSCLPPQRIPNRTTPPHHHPHTHTHTPTHTTHPFNENHHSVPTSWRYRVMLFTIRPPQHHACARPPAVSFRLLALSIPLIQSLVQSPVQSFIHSMQWSFLLFSHKHFWSHGPVTSGLTALSLWPHGPATLASRPLSFNKNI